MIRALLNVGIRRFGARYNYETNYMSHVTDISTSAGLRLSLLSVYSQFPGPPKARNIRAGAVIGSTQEGDCGPCLQLVVDTALEAGVAADQISLCLQGKAQSAGDVGLGFRFAQSAIANGPELEDLRQEIESRFGAAAVVAASFAASSGRIYPVLKRGLGYGQACSLVTLKEDAIQVLPKT